MRDCCKMHYRVPAQCITVIGDPERTLYPSKNEALNDEDNKDEEHGTTMS